MSVAAWQEDWMACYVKGCFNSQNNDYSSGEVEDLKNLMLEEIFQKHTLTLTPSLPLSLFLTALVSNPGLCAG